MRKGIEFEVGAADCARLEAIVADRNRRQSMSSGRDSCRWPPTVWPRLITGGLRQATVCRWQDRFAAKLATKKSIIVDLFMAQSSDLNRELIRKLEGRVAKLVEIGRRGSEGMVWLIRRRGQGRRVSGRGGASQRPGAWGSDPRGGGR